MDWWITNILEKGLRGELKDNQIASQLFNLAVSGELYSTSREDLVPKLLNKSTAPQFEDRQKATEGVSDKRFLHLALRNLKKYPGRVYGETGVDNVFFGMPFSSKGIPMSMVCLGANGSGKTSIYSALEFMGMKKCNTAFVRGYQRLIGQVSMLESLEKDQSEYLCHSAPVKVTPEIVLARVDKQVECDNLIKFVEGEEEVIPQAFYCSDYDVRMLEASKNYSTFLIDQLNLRHLYDSLQLLYFTWGYVGAERRKYEKWCEANPNNVGKEELQLRELAELLIFGFTVNRRRNTESLQLALQKSLNINKGMSDIRGGGENSLEYLHGLNSMLTEEQNLFSSKQWYAVKIWKNYKDCLRKAESVEASIIAGNPDNDAIASLCKKLMEIDQLRKLIAVRLEEYVNSRSNTSVYTEDCDARLDKLTETKVRILQYRPVEHRFMKEVYDKEAYNRYTSDIRQLIVFLEEEIKKVLEEWKDKICDTFKILISDYFEVDNDDVDISMDFIPVNLALLVSDTEAYKRETVYDFIKFRIRIKSSGGDYSTKNENRFDADPRAYLNTFKFKLFCITLKLACCCVAKRMYKVNYPMVIDDVFDASDFENRVAIRSFAEGLVRQHSKLLSESEYALQVIFFTQDDLVASQMEQGLKDGMGAEKVLGARIFDYHEVDPKTDSILLGKREEIEVKYLSIVDVDRNLEN